jgi:uncharacterized phage-associated protein
VGVMSEIIQFRPKIDKIIETILYLCHKGIELDQYKTVKLLYLSDREHFINFGRPITFDHYYAFECGPVASRAFDILKGNRVQGFEREDLPFEIQSVGKFKFVENPKRSVNTKLFSKSDLKVLDQISHEYGDKTFKKLYDLTHNHFAYKSAWAQRGAKKSHPMDFGEFLEGEARRDKVISDLKFISKAI